MEGQPAVPYVWLRALFGEDEEEFDYNLLLSGAPKNVEERARRRANGEGDALFKAGRATLLTHLE